MINWIRKLIFYYQDRKYKKTEKYIQIKSAIEMSQFIDKMGGDYFLNQCIKDNYLGYFITLDGIVPPSCPMVLINEKRK